MTWQISESEPKPGQTVLVMREKNPEDMTKEQLLDYISQLEAVIDHKNSLIERYKVAFER